MSTERFAMSRESNWMKSFETLRIATPNRSEIFPSTSIARKPTATTLAPLCGYLLSISMNFLVGESLPSFALA
jgi:hypothetical protein